MKKVLVYTENFERGGGNQYLVDIVNNIPKDYLVDILSNRGGIFKEDFDKIKVKYTYNEIDILSIHTLNEKAIFISGGSKTILFLLRVFIYFSTYILFFIFKKINTLRIKQFVKKRNYNLIISCNGAYPGGLTCLDCIGVAKSENIRSWLTIVSMPNIQTSAVDLIYRGVLNKADKFMVNSTKVADEFLKRRLVESKRIRVLYNCLSNNSIDIVPEQQLIYNASLEEYVLGYVGRVEKTKGIFYLLDAFSQLLPVFPNLKLVIVGDGAYLNSAKAYCLEKGIDEKVHFMGFYAGNISSVLKTFNLFIFPSLWEGLPYSILEAMGNSKIVISTNVGGITEIIEDGKNGFLIPPADLDLLVEKIKFVLNDFKDYDIMAQNALSTIRNRFSENNFSNEMSSLFNSIK